MFALFFVDRKHACIHTVQSIPHWLLCVVRYAACVHVPASVGAAAARVSCNLRQAAVASAAAAVHHLTAWVSVGDVGTVSNNR